MKILHILQIRHIRILSDHVQWVEREMRKMTTILGYTENYKHLEDQHDRLVALKGETFDQYSYVYAGIDQMLISSKLNSALIHPPFRQQSPHSSNPAPPEKSSGFVDRRLS